MANWYGKATIDGEDPDYYFSGQQTETKPSSSGVLEKSKQELLDLGYSEKQINDAVKAGKLKLK